MQLLDAMRLAGLNPRDVIADGRWHRCPTEAKPRRKNGAYVVRGDGSVVFGDFAVGEWHQWRDNEATIRVDVAAIRKAQQEEAKRKAHAIHAARGEWNGFKGLAPGHPYLARKGLDMRGCFELRQHDGLIVAPVRLGVDLISYQTIADDGTKRFRAGCPVRGGAFVIGRRNAAVTCFTEGLATGLAVFQCVNEAAVVVCYDAGNLVAVAGRWTLPGRRMVCADNDHETEKRIGTNPGLTKAREAAELLGCKVAAPEGIHGTDWADAMLEWGARGPYRVAMAIRAAIG